MQIDPTIFKDYDIRALVDEQLDLEGVARLGFAMAEFFEPERVVIGYDMRPSSPDWFQALAESLIKMGVDVINLGLIATDMSYYAAGELDVDLAVMISASHNPASFNGFKLVKRGAVGVSGETGIYQLRDLVMSDQKFEPVESEQHGSIEQRDILDEWINHALSLVAVDQLKPFKVVVDAGNGMAGKVVPVAAKQLPIDLIPLFFELDGTFPNHLANPLLPETWSTIQKTIKKEKADLGIMFDGDGDRMFLFDERGQFVSGTITTAMVAEQILKKKPASPILYNAICGRVVPETIETHGGEAHRVKVGHTLIKAAMRKYDAEFAGEHSGHYYFKDNFYADSGLIAVLVVLELLSQKQVKMSELVKQYDRYPSSGEINFSVENKQTILKKLQKKFAKAEKIDQLDGVSIWFEDWWANIRPSNTQPVLRLNVEADNPTLLEEKTQELKEFIFNQGGKIADEH